MPVQSIEIKDFTGGRNFLTSPFNLYPTEAPVFRNISLDSSGMKTRNFIYGAQLLPAREVAAPIQLATTAGEAYDLDFATSSYTEKVRFLLGDRFIIKGGIPYKLDVNNELHATVVANPFIGEAEAEQFAFTSPPTAVIDRVVTYTYYISYITSAGFESPLEQIGIVNSRVSWDANYTTETASTQTVVIQSDAGPIAGDYGRIWRMGDNISYPSLVFQFDSAWAVSLEQQPVTTSNGTFTFATLDDYLGQYATTWGATYPINLQYLASTKYGLAAANGSQVYLSMSRPDAWSALSSLNFGSEVTGIASVYRGFLVFTEGAYLYLVTGASLSSLNVNLLSTDVGCTSNSTISEIGQNALVWIYDRRFYMFNGSHVSELEPNTYDYLYFLKYGYFNDLTAVSLENKYIISNRNILTIVDLSHRYKPFIEYEVADMYEIEEFPAYIREINVDGIKQIGMYQPNGSFYAMETFTYGDTDWVDPIPPDETEWFIGCYDIPADPADPIDCNEDLDETTCLVQGIFGYYDPDWIDICDQGAELGIYPYYELPPGEEPPAPVLYMSDYRSPMFTFGNMNAQCTFSSVEVLFEGELFISAFIDSNEVNSSAVYYATTPRTARLLLPNATARGNFLQVRLRFNGAVYGYRVNGDPLMQYSK